MKKIIALVLAAAMLLCLAACSKSEPEPLPSVTLAPTSATESAEKPTDAPAADPTEAGASDAENTETTPGAVSVADYAEAILGAWAWDLVITSDMLGEEDFPAGSSIAIPCIMVFEDGQKVTMMADPSRSEDVAQQVYTLFLETFTEGLYDQFTDETTDREAADAAMKEANGMTIPELALLMIDGITDEDLLDMISLSDLVESAEYTLTSDQLVIDDATFTISISGDSLTLLDCDNADALDLFGTIPLTLTRTEVPEIPELPAEGDDASLVGSWCWIIPMNTSEYFGEIEGMDDTFNMPMLMTFESDGTLRLGIDAKNEQFLADVLHLIRLVAQDTLRASYEDEGLTGDDLENAMKEGMDYMDLYLSSLSGDELIDSMGLNDQETTATYKVEGDILYLENTPVSFTLDSGTLTLVPEEPLDLSGVQVEPPFVLTRVR